MNLFDVLFARKTGGGSGGGDVTAAGGFSILWDGITEGREYIDLEALLGANFYKISDKVFSVEDLAGSLLVAGLVYYGSTGPQPRELLETVALEILPGVAALAQEGTINSNPILLSAKAGDYNYNGATVHVPSDGVYSVLVVDGIGEMYIEAVYNHDRNRDYYNS